MRSYTLAAMLVAAAFACPQQVVHQFDGPMPTGVTVSSKGRIFVCFPRWGDDVRATVAELRGNELLPYPNRDYNPGWAKRGPADRLVSVQSVVVDPRDRLWMLDTGSVKLGPTIDGAPKMVAVDLATNRVVRVIKFPPNVALKSTYLNDVRFDLRRGKGGYAFITDSSGSGPNAIIVVDLASGRSWRRLNDHPSVKADPNMDPIVEGGPLRQRPRPGVVKRMTMGSDGIAISRDGGALYYCPLISRRLYSVSTDALVDETRSEAEVAATVKDLGEKGASDGLETDAQGRLIVTDYEHHSVRWGPPGGPYRGLSGLASIFWPDTLSIGPGGYVYLLANELQRQPSYHEGRDLRVKPYRLVRWKTGSKPVRLK